MYIQMGVLVNIFLVIDTIVIGCTSAQQLSSGVWHLASIRVACRSKSGYRDRFFKTPSMYLSRFTLVNNFRLGSLSHGKHLVQALPPVPNW